MRRDKYCPHSELRGIYGDEANHGFRLQCETCGQFLRGDPHLAGLRKFTEEWITVLENSQMGYSTNVARSMVHASDYLRDRGIVLSRFADRIQANNAELAIRDSYGQERERDSMRVLSSTETAVAVDILRVVKALSKAAADLIDRQLENALGGSE